MERGLGFAFCMDCIVDTEGSRNLAFRPFAPELALDACLAVKKYRELSPAAKLFLERLRDEVRG